MCYDCCKEFKGWCKSFTRIEAWLSVLQALLLVVLIAFLTFLILHLLACSRESNDLDQKQSPNTTTATESTTAPAYAPTIVPILPATEAKGSPSTVSPDIECTWTPSKKTKAPTHYYWSNDVTDDMIILSNPQTSTNALQKGEEAGEEFDGVKFEENSDERDASQDYKNYVAALVKLKPPEKVTFGCILTKVTLQWTLTAASCIESIEEVDSLDSFFIMDSYGETQEGKSHAMVDVQIHPLYQGANRSYDLAALRSEDVLISNTHLLLQLPTVLEYFLVALGERFTILGYGGYRTVDNSPTGRRLRQAWTHTVSLSQCSAGGADDTGDAWAPRHLLRGAEVRAGACGAGGACGARALCAGAVRARAAPCAFCGGTPLLRAGKLFGVMSDNRHCGVSCEPALYVNVAALRDWLDSLEESGRVQVVTVCANKVLLLASLLMAAFIVCTIGAAVIQIIAVIEEGGSDSNKTTPRYSLDDFP